MKQKLVITPLGGGNVNVPLIFKFDDTVLNRYYFIPNTYNQVISDKKFVFGNKVLQHEFNSTSQSFIYEWDDENGLQSDIALVMQRHPLVDCIGNDNLKNPIFKLTILSKKSSNDALIIKKKGLIFNLINNTTLGRMRDSAFAAGTNPVGKTYSDIFISLVDFDSGILMKDLDKSISLLEDDMDQTYIVMRKAIELGVIAYRDGIYYVKNEVAGANEDAVLLYLKENKSMYEQYVRREVSIKDKLPAEDYEKRVADEVGVFQDIKAYRRKTVDEDLEMKMLKDEAKDLKIKGYHLIQSIEGLKSVIRKAKEKTSAPEKEEVKTEQ